jgi:hypothetical protein
LVARNSNNEEELDALLYDMQAIEIVVIFWALSTASNKGFTYGVATTGHVLKDDQSIVRVAQVWCGPKSTWLIYTTVWRLLFHALPAWEAEPTLFGLVCPAYCWWSLALGC